MGHDEPGTVMRAALLTLESRKSDQAAADPQRGPSRPPECGRRLLHVSRDLDLVDDHSAAPDRGIDSEHVRVVVGVDLAHACCERWDVLAALRARELKGCSGRSTTFESIAIIRTK